MCKAIYRAFCGLYKWMQMEVHANGMHFFFTDCIGRMIDVVVEFNIKVFKFFVFIVNIFKILCFDNK